MSLKTKAFQKSRLIYASIYLVILYIPILILPLFSFNDSIYIAFPLKGFTFKWYGVLLENEGLHAALGNSLSVALTTALLSTILGTASALALTRYNFRGKNLALGLIMAPLAFPGVILGVSLLVLLNLADIKLSLLTVGFGHVLICTPFSTAVLMSRLEGFEMDLEEASLDLGENRWMTFWRITFWLALPGLISSFMLSFTISFDEFIIAFFLSQGEATLPVYLWSQMRFPDRLPMVLALATILIGVSFLVVYIAEKMRHLGKSS